MTVVPFRSRTPDWYYYFGANTRDWIRRPNQIPGHRYSLRVTYQYRVTPLRSNTGPGFLLQAKYQGGFTSIQIEYRYSAIPFRANTRDVVFLKIQTPPGGGGALQIMYQRLAAPIKKISEQSYS